MERFNDPMGFEEYQGPAEMDFWVVDLHEVRRRQEEGQAAVAVQPGVEGRRQRHDSVDEEAEEAKPL